jgi:putative aldouronate transport system substrate-binding protein
VPWRYIAQRPFVHFQPELPGYARKAHEAEKAILPLAVDDPTLGLYAPALYKAGATAERAFNDGVSAIILGREPLTTFDGLVRDWQNAAGNQVRREYQSALAGAK